MNRTRFVLALLVLATAACAPRVSKKAPQSAVVAQHPAPAKASPRRAEPAKSVAPQPATSEPKIVQASYVVAKPAPSPSPTPEPAAEPPPPPPAPKKKTYYSYSDQEIATLRKQSKEFKKLDDELKSCTKKTEAAIERREQIPTEIAKIRMSPGGLNPAKEAKIAKLKAEQERLKGSADRSACNETEQKLNALLDKASGGSSTTSAKAAPAAEEEIY